LPSSFQKKLLPFALYSSVEMVYFDIVDNQGENIPEPAVKKFRVGLQQQWGLWHWPLIKLKEELFVAR
jgi:hypothetical protein